MKKAQNPKLYLTITFSNDKLSENNIMKGKIMTEHNNAIETNDLTALSKEEEEFLIKFRKLADEDKCEIKNYIFSFDVDSNELK